MIQRVKIFNRPRENTINTWLQEMEGIIKVTNMVQSVLPHESGDHAVSLTVLYEIIRPPADWSKLDYTPE